MATSKDQGKALTQRINDAAREAAKSGVKEAYGVAGVGVLTGCLVKALDRIDRLEGDIKLLTDLLADMEKNSND